VKAAGQCLPALNTTILPAGDGAPAGLLALSMVFSENRHPLFRTML